MEERRGKSDRTQGARRPLGPEKLRLLHHALLLLHVLLAASGGGSAVIARIAEEAIPKKFPPTDIIVIQLALPFFES
jgi:hypothetical protein